MKVYEINLDVNHYQYFLTVKEEDRIKLNTDCQPRLPTWNPPPVFVYKPLHQKGDFFQFGASGLISNSRATDALRDFYEMAGELLPLPYKGEIYTLLNVMECIDYLDAEKTEWVCGRETEDRLYPKKYVFHPDRFSASPIFKIPQTHRSHTYVVEGCGELEEEFRVVVERNQLQGLVFEELWASDS